MTYELKPSDEDLEKIVAEVESEKKEADREQKRPVLSLVTDGVLAETVFDRRRNRTQLAICNRATEEVVMRERGEDRGMVYVPYPASHDFIARGHIRLPSAVGDPLSDIELAARIRSFVGKYLSVSPLFKELIPYYVMLTWVHDRFDALPYLRATGDYGTGKSRFLKVVGTICYKPFFAAGAATPSPIFRSLEEFHPTLIIDEADFNRSDAKAEIVKILNCGFMKGVPVLRSEETRGKKFNTRSFDVFGPKIVATRQGYYDQALESRFLTEDMDYRERNPAVPINLPDTFEDEAEEIRNLLLRWRFEKYDRIALKPELMDPRVADRLNQIALPLKSIVSDEALRLRITEMVYGYHLELIEARGSEDAAGVLDAILVLIAEGNTQPTIGLVTERYNQQYALPQEKLTSKKIGSIVRKKLKIRPIRQKEGYTIMANESTRDHLAALKKKYGIEDAEG